MKRLFILALLILLAIPTAEAKRRETPEEIERKTRHNEGWEWGAVGRFSLIFYEMDHMSILGEKQTVYKSQARLGGNLMLNGGYHINNHWKIGMEAGIQMQYNYKAIIPVYLTAHYFYGKRKNCLFNFINLGTNMLFNKVNADAMSDVSAINEKFVHFGATGAGGIGFRFQSPDRKDKIDITLGYQVLMLAPSPVIKGSFGYNTKDVKRLELNQQVFIGIGITF